MPHAAPKKKSTPTDSTDYGYSAVDASPYPGGGDIPDWAQGTWYDGFAYREIPDTGVKSATSLLPRTSASQANEMVMGLGAAALVVAAMGKLIAA